MTGFRCPPVRANRLLLALAVCAITAIAPCGVALASGQDHHGDDHHGHGNGHHGHGNQGTLFVSSSGSSGGAGYSCATANYSTIQSAVDAAPAGGTVIVCPGTYTENVVISQPLKLQGLGATVHGASTNTIMCDQLGPKGPGSALCLAAITIKSSWVQVRGFTVTGAIGEGILATGSLASGSISNVSITGNRVANNDLGGIPPNMSSPYPQCVEVGEIPGDCGEGIHLMGAYNSVVTGNDVTGNSGGVLLTDEFGPTHHNLVAGNVIKDNLFDCGVTVPGHNPNALDKSGNRQPAMAGDYDNVIAGNWITGNGVKGEGAGVLFANAAPGSASYDNLVIHNFIAGNELAGVTLHAHPVPPGMFEDLNGNRIIRNTIGQNNLGGDPDAGVTDTTGVLVFGAVPVTVKIAGNRIFNNTNGIWLGTGGNITATLRHNRFFNVTRPVLVQP